MTKRRLLWTVCPIYLLFWMGDAFLTSYYSLYFVNRGMSEQEQSILLAVIPLSLLIGCFVMSPFAKNPAKAIWLFRFCAVMETGLAIGYAFCDTFVSLLVLTLLISFCNGAPFTFLEGYVAPLGKKAGIPYSSIRLFGTLGYVVSLAFGYLILSRFPLSHAYFFASALTGVALAISFILPKSEESKEDEAKEESSQVSKRGLVFFIVSSVFFFGMYTTVTYVMPIYLNRLGTSDADYSLMRSVGVGVELVALLLMPFVDKFIKRKKTPLIIAVVVCAIGTGLGLFVKDPYAYGYSFFVLSGIGKGFLFGYQALFLGSLASSKYLPKALTINTGCVNVTVTLMNYGSASIYNAISFPGYFGLMAGLQLLGILFLALIPSQKSEQPKESA